MKQFQLLCTVSTGEIHSMIDGKYYVHFLDAAFIPKFKRLYEKSNGNALNFLKQKSRSYSVDGVLQDQDQSA